MSGDPDQQATLPNRSDEISSTTCCRSCGSNTFSVLVSGICDYEYGAPGIYSYLFCTECQLLNIDPPPTSDILDLAYPDDYHAYAPPMSLLGRLLKRSYWRSKAKSYAKLVRAGARILDVGCAHGDFLEQMKKQGFTDLWGVEFKNEIASLARARGFNTITGELEKVRLPKDSFDLIVMTNFIEHVENPLLTLRHCKLLLKPGGLVVGETPSYECWDRRIFGRYWGGYHAPRHLALFNPASLKRIAINAGFPIVDISNLLQPAHWALSLQNLLVSSGRIKNLRYGRTWAYPLILMLFFVPNLIQTWFSTASSVNFHFRRD